MDIDFSKAPEGATHYELENGAAYWHKVADGVIHYLGVGREWLRQHHHVELYEIPNPKPFVGVEDALADAGLLNRSQAAMLKTHQQIKRLGQATTGITHDPVNNPSHYASGGVECIEAIKASMSHEAFLGYLKGNAQKYLWRYEKKANPVEDLKKANPVEDLKKAQWYLARLTEEQGASDA